jgi:hypothetical protein
MRWISRWGEFAVKPCGQDDEGDGSLRANDLAEIDASSYRVASGGFRRLLKPLLRPKGIKVPCRISCQGRARK